MSGFMTSTTAMRVFKVSGEAGDYSENLESAAFSAQPEAVGPDGKRVGWVGLGDPLDTSFRFGPDIERFIALSMRIDERKPSAAAVKMRLAEAIKKEKDANDGKISRVRKKELKEIVTAKVAAKADFVPTLVDCIWDVPGGTLMLSATADQAVSLTLEIFERTFGVKTELVLPDIDMAAFFRSVYLDERPRRYQLADGVWVDVLPDNYAVTLSSPEGAEEKAIVVAKGDMETGMKALENGLLIRKMGLSLDFYHGEAGDESQPGEAVVLTLADDFTVSGLKLPKAERGAEREADFILKAECCVSVAEVIAKIALPE